ncbi:unnamed protein product [Ixodes pacificus]
MFLYKFGLSLREKLQEDWTSYGVRIGSKDDEITPWEIIDVQVSTTVDPPAATTEPVTPMSDRALFGYLVFVYRVLTIKDRGTVQYRNNVQGKLAAFLLTPPFSAPSADFSEAGGSYSVWYSNHTYLGMIAALDMFFHRFPMNELAPARFGTMPSRFRDCAVQTALVQLMKTAGLSLQELYLWIFVDVVAHDAVAIMKSGEEMHLAHSYAPYLTDLRLVQKSPYSAASNCALHTWLHTLGSLLLSERSLNARHISDFHFDKIAQNVLLLAFARRGVDEFRISFVNNLAKAEEESRRCLWTDQYCQELGTPTTRDPLQWYTFLASKQHQVPQEIYRHFHRLMEGLKNLREGTIGDKIRTYLRAYGGNWE